MEAAGLGIARECELLKLAKETGLASLAYVRTVDEVKIFAEIGVEMFCIQLGANAGRFSRPPGVFGVGMKGAISAHSASIAPLA